MNAILQDLRYAFRQLRKNPGFAITAILTLALGIGATTAVFSVAYGVLIDPFPYKDVHTLATPKICSPQWTRCGWEVYTPAQFREVQNKTTLFSSMTASTISDVALTGLAEPLRLRGNYITPNTFDVLGVQPILGRETSESDVRPGAGEVVLLSYRCWKAHFGGDPHVLGRVLTLNSHPRTVIGVMPPRFLWRGGDVYLPINMTTADNGDHIQGQTWFSIVGRLKPGVTDAQAAAQLRPIFDEFAKTSQGNFPKDIHDWRLGIMTFDLMFQSGLASTLYLILGAVFVLLLIACINVSSLLLARAVSRGHEFTVRAAIGASRWRLVRYTLTESLLLAFAAMPVALLFAYAGLQATLRIVPTETIPDEAVVTMNLPVLFASLGLALVTVLIFGMAPAWHAANPRLAAALASGVRSSGSRVQRRLLSGFVVTEIALSLALLMLAGLMVRSLMATLSVPVAFEPTHTLLMRVPLDETRYPKPENRITFWRQFLSDAQNVPGVKAVTLDVGAPAVTMSSINVQIGGEAVDKRRVSYHLVTPGYLAASGLRMVQGHFIDDREVVDKASEMVVSESFAKRYFAGENALGRVVHLPDLLAGDAKTSLKSDAFTVVGVMQDLPAPAWMTEIVPNVFLPYTVVPAFGDTVIVSTALPASDMATAMRRVVHNIDRDQPVTDVMSLGQMLDMYGYASSRFTLALFGTFAVAALALSLVGIYGVLSFITSQRTQEIGIRMALGAQRGNVMWMVLRQACILAGMGVVVGLPLAFFAGRFAKDQLVQTSQHDPLTLVLAVCVLPLLAIVGTWLPARRAAAIDPVRALRAD